MASLSPVAKLQFFDVNGDPLSGGKLHTYDTGTTTPKTTYTDLAGATPNANPIILDSRGECICYLQASQYRFVLKDSADATIWTSDGVTSDIVAASLNGTVPKIVASVAEMKALTGMSNGAMVQTAEYYAGTVGGDGLYRYNSGSSATDNGGTVIAPDAGGGRWLLLYDAFAGVSALSFGVKADDSTDNSAPLAAALASGKTYNHKVTLPQGVMRYSTQLNIYSGMSLVGATSQESILKYTGSAIGFRNETPGTRIYGVTMSGFRLWNTGTGTTGIELDSVSSSIFYDVACKGWTVNIYVYSPTSGYSVYNRFHSCYVEGGTGYQLGGTSSNSNIFQACRANACTVRGVNINDCNDNTFIDCQFESGGTGTAVYLDASAPGLAPGNRFINIRLEGFTGGVGFHIASSNPSDTIIQSPTIQGTVTTPLTDLGTRTKILFPNGSTFGSKDASALSAATGTPWLFERTSQGGSSVPAMIVRDSATGGGTPVTLQIETERNAGESLQIKRGGVSYFSVTPAGKMTTNTAVLTAVAPTVAASQIGLGSTTATTIGANGGASALTANPVGYMRINVAGTAYQIPYYNV